MDTRASARPASLAEINAVLGTVPRGTSSANVLGMHPEKIRCSEIMITDRMSLTGHMTTHFIAANGTIQDTAIGFVYGDRGTGLYSPAPNTFNASCNGQIIAQFTPAGLGITSLFSPTSIIDFGGATITNIGGMDITNSWSFSINPTSPTTTYDDTPTTILTIPVVPVAPPCDVIFDIRAHVVFASGAPTAPSGSTTFRARIKLLSGDPAPTISALYDESIYIDQALGAASVTMAPSAGAALIIANPPPGPFKSRGIPPPIITWTAMCSVVRTEVSHIVP